MREITFYQFQEKQFNKTGISNFNLVIDCEKCKNEYKILVKKFLRRKKFAPFCTKCYFKECVCDEEWRKNNSKAQKIAQNRPEVLEKQRKAQLRRWELGGDDLRERYVQIGKNLWKRKSYRDNQIKRIRENWENLKYREKIFNNSKKQYVGKYKENFYHSLVEFSFLLYCEEKKHSVRNYDGPGIEYEFKNKIRRYYPDYIINNDTIIEVKGRGRWYNQNREQIEIKFSTLAKWCKSNNMKCRFIFDKDIGKRFWKEAKKLYEIEKENIQTLQGESL